MKFFGINDSFDWSKLAFQKDTSKNIIMLNEGLKELMGYTRKNKMKVVNIGLKMFTRNKGSQQSGGYRILQEALDVLMPHMDESRVINVKREVFLAFKDKSDHMLTFEELANEW